MIDVLSLIYIIGALSHITSEFEQANQQVVDPKQDNIVKEKLSQQVDQQNH